MTTRAITVLRIIFGGSAVVAASHDGLLYGVVINPLLVATIQRLPHQTIDSTLPSPGTMSPGATFQMPLGPSKTAVPLITFRTVQPLTVVGLVSGTGTSLACGLASLFFGAIGW